MTQRDRAAVTEEFMVEAWCGECGKLKHVDTATGLCVSCLVTIEKERPRGGLIYGFPFEEDNVSDDIEIEQKTLNANRCVIIGPRVGQNLTHTQDKFLLGVGDVVVLEIDMKGKSVVFRDKDGGTVLRAEWFASGVPQVTFSANPDLAKRNSYNDIIDAFRMFVEAMEEGKEP